MRRFIAALAAVVLLATTVPVYAGGYGGKHRGAHFMSGKQHSYSRHGGQYYRYGGHYGHKHKHHDYGYYALGALAGGIVIGGLLSQPRYSYSTTTHIYDIQPAALGNCVQTTGTRVEYGRLAEYGGTMCYDRYNRAYVLQDSVNFIRYLN
ncbi:MAG: hypothetical protein ACTSW2_05865 [Alphaproteobacteria bacterium]